VSAQVVTRRRGFLRNQPAYVWTLLLALVLNMFAGNWSYLGVPVPLDRGMLVLAIVLLVLDQRPWSLTGVRWSWVHAVMGLLVLLATASALFHGTLQTSYGAYALLDRLVIPFTLLTVAPVVFRTAGQRDLVLKTLTVVGAYLGLVALAGAVGLDGVVFPRYINDPSVGIQYGRARGPFVESEAMGIVLCQCGFAAAVLATRTQRAWRAVSIVVVVLAPLGVLLTLTRSVWVGTAVGVALAMVVDRRLRRWVPVVLVAGAMATLLALAVVPGLAASASDRAGTSRSVDDRLNTNDAALRIIEREPLFGVGWVEFIAVNSEFVRQADSYPITNTAIEVHNVALGRAAELGLPGGALWVLCVLGGPVQAALRRVRAPNDLQSWRLVLLGSTTCWLTATLLSPVPYPMANNLAFLLAGVVLAPVMSRPRGEAAIGDAVNDQ
jgi:putative inorganic carbon (HCO3(-)) transporter